MPENLIFCSKCGAQNQSVAQFCQRCGAGVSVPGTAVQPMAPPPPAYAAAPAMAYAAQPPVVYATSIYGGFWLRVAAYLIDGIILNIVATPLIFIFFMPALTKIMQEAERNNSEPSPELIGSLIGSMMVFFVVLFAGQWLYEALMTCSSWQGTIGKRVLRLKVTDAAGNPVSFGRATGRFFGKLVSGLIMDIGFIMVAFTDRKRGLHDMLADTLVLRY